MTVKDFIKKLELLDGDAEVITSSSNFELGGADVPVTMIHQYDTAKIETKTFRDAFDGDTYNKKVYSIIGGDLKVVYIS